MCSTNHNVSVGAVLYTSYLTCLGLYHDPSAGMSKSVFPPPPVTATLAAGLTAGAIQSIVRSIKPI